MADVNTGSAPGGFIFGQNMEERVIKPADSSNGSDEKEDGDKDTENGTGSGTDNEASSTQGSGAGSQGTASPLLRPSTFNPSSCSAGGLIAPSRLGNTFASRSTGTCEGGGLVSSTISQNPFAVPAHSDSEDDRREKPIVAPAHFRVTGSFGSSSIFGGGAASNTSANLTASKLLLRPSVLDKQTENFHKGPDSTGGDSTSSAYKSSFRLEPAKLQSPFCKPEDGAEPSEDKENEEAATEAPEEAPAVSQRLPSEASPETSSSPSDTTSTSTNGIAQGPSSSEEKHSATSSNNSPESSGSFVFARGADTQITSTTGGGSGRGSGFVFGENLTARVSTTPQVGDNHKPQHANNSTSPPPGDAAEGTSPTQTLAESAAAHQARHAKPEFQKVDVQTGEENESNVFQLNTKLFVFDKVTQSWVEKGRGLLRLNDMGATDTQAFQSRVVMRTTGSLRVVLNTKIWSSMLIERASQKSVRISAIDPDEGVKIFLIMANPKDADQIYSAIDSRVQQLKTYDLHHGGSLSPPLDSQASSLCEPQVSSSQASSSEKRQRDCCEDTTPAKKPKYMRQKVTDIAGHQIREESNDSSTVDPETEASNESFASSPTVKSSSSDA